MIIITTKNKINNKFMPMISIIKDKQELKKQTKKQLMQEIIENPTSIRAYRNIEVYAIGLMNENNDIYDVCKKKLFSYEEILNEIIETITGEIKDDKSKPTKI